MAAIKCGCGKLNWIDSGGGGTCVSCGAPFGVGRQPIAVAVASYTSSGNTCDSCQGPRTADACPTCGWDSAVKIRYCVQCRGVCAEDCAIDANNLGIAGGAAGLCGFLVFRLFGLLGTIAILAAIASVICLVNGLSLKIQCGSCRREVSQMLLTDGERDQLRRGRLRDLVLTGVLGLAAIGCAVLWILAAIWLSRP